MFAFVLEEVKDNDHQFYRDVLHPSIHGDAMHISMRLRDEKSRRTWVHKVIFHTNHVYVRFMLQFAESGLVPAQMHEYFKNESLKSLLMMTTQLNRTYTPYTAARSDRHQQCPHSSAENASIF